MADSIKEPIYKRWWFWVVVFVLLVALGQTGSKDTGDVLVTRKTHRVDCAGFDKEVRQIPGLLEKIESQRRNNYRPIRSDYFIDKALIWCANASNDIYGKQGADKILQTDLLFAPKVHPYDAVKPENRNVINAFDRLAQEHLCPSWNTEELTITKLLAKPGRRFISCQ